ncbi:hypothetical protein LO762_21340 [Actinocorallia sp. API 0066]|uniref:hypothetical protein n=1 Tax=Actinocorallia sp. API 0066 TaxID=2896846 RepID=UPI001E5B5813|nr:hypothetical protein [Actinocorallia sp. API 0066]MCD0451720.1 hypothetical protein [Actinocorallia sp. API 0066]
MSAFVPFLILVAPAAVPALVVLAVRLRGAVRDGGAPAAMRAALRNGVRRPVRRWLLAVGVGAGLVTAGAEWAYLAVVSGGPREGFDVVLLALVLGLFGAVGCAAVACLGAVAVTRARGFGAGTVVGLFVLGAVAGGVAAAYLPVRAAYLAEPGGFPVVANLADGDLLVPFDAFLLALAWCVPWPILTAALAARPATATPRDVWQLLLDLATASLPANRATWGAALRAELAAVDAPAERRGFAVGGAWAALRTGWLAGAWAWALGVAAVVAAGSFTASRWSLAHGQGGILGFWLTFPGAVLLGVALAAAWRHRSFGSGLRTGMMSGAAAFVAVLVVAVPEAVVWASRRAGYLSTGDAVPPTWQSAVLDVLRPEFLLTMLTVWAVGMAGGAALGTALGRLRRPPTGP